MTGNNKLIELYNKMNKIYRFATNRKVINFVFIICLSFMALGIILLIIGLAMTQLSNTSRQAISITGACVAGLFFISFYIFEYLRRRTNIYLSRNFNFSNLLSEDLKQHQIIDKDPYVLETYKDEFIKEHMDYASRQINQRTLSRDFLLYGLENKNQLIIYSQAKVNEIDNKKKFSVVNYNQVLIGVKNNLKIKPSLIVEKNKYNFAKTMHNNVFEISEFNLYTDEDNANKLEKIIKQIKLLNELGLSVDVKINHQFIFFCITSHNNFLSLLPNYKFYKQEWDEIFKQYQLDKTTLINILNIL